MRLENDLKPHNKDTYKKMQEVLKTNNKTASFSQQDQENPS